MACTSLMWIVSKDPCSYNSTRNSQKGALGEGVNLRSEGFSSPEPQMSDFQSNIWVYIRLTTFLNGIIKDASKLVFGETEIPWKLLDFKCRSGHLGNMAANQLCIYMKEVHPLHYQAVDLSKCAFRCSQTSEIWNFLLVQSGLAVKCVSVLKQSQQCQISYRNPNWCLEAWSKLRLGVVSPLEPQNSDFWVTGYTSRWHKLECLDKAKQHRRGKIDIQEASGPGGCGD